MPKEAPSTPPVKKDLSNLQQKIISVSQQRNNLERKSLIARILWRRKSYLQLQKQLNELQVKLDPFLGQNFPFWAKTSVSFLDLLAKSTVWFVVAEKEIDREKKRTIADLALDRSELRRSRDKFDWLQCQYEPLLLPAPGSLILIYPSLIFLKQSNAAWSVWVLQESAFNFEEITYLEDEKVNKKAEVIGYSWEKANLDGTLDRRYKSNRPLPLVQYGLMTLNLNETQPLQYLFSNLHAFRSYKETFEAHLSSL